MKSPIFEGIENIHSDAPWGSVLDAGAGISSLRWVSDLATERWTGVTWMQDHAQEIETQLKLPRRAQDRLLVGNWNNPGFLSEEKFDTVIADYLLGAVEPAAPFFQQNLLHRLRKLTKRRIYIVGLEPYTLYLPNNEEEALAGEIGRHRDSCILLAGHIPHRELPLGWVRERLPLANFKEIDLRKFLLRDDGTFLKNQIALANHFLTMIKDKNLTRALNERSTQLSNRIDDILSTKKYILQGKNYLIAAIPIPTD